jgi:predicted Ser/Thr protein kinase
MRAVDPTRLDDGDAPTTAADETRLASGSGAETRAAPKSGTASTTSGGRRLSGPESIDHGRFAPGVVIADRYRMIGRLGSGGMGEVYRADDLKLGQPVALKFLPEAVDRDPARLTQLHSEVRIARQISHPHVCRVYDIDEYEGHTFLSMEYVDGEDLASLLRRVGRLAPTRAVELARQICSGLAAAHDKGVVHRDLKPANIMLDGAGQIRITDFGLAGAIGESPRAGTPAYMAPEQLAGQAVTPRSDVYALGLVLYELFTGARALNARNLAELIAKREQVDITPPTTIVRDLDPAIEHVILRCLERDPAKRPGSALAVAAALPGGDPLAAALAAGTTLSPDAVAAAGEDTAWALRPALIAVTLVLVGLVVQVWLGDLILVTGHLPIEAPAAVMEDRALQIRQRLGYREPFVDSLSSFSIESAYLQFMTRRATAEEIRRRLHLRPVPLHFWVRTSPRALVPMGPLPLGDTVDPPPLVSGMTTTIVDSKGRLVSFHAMPPQLETSPSGETAATPDWNALFAAADLPRDRFTPVPSRWTPPGYAESAPPGRGRWRTCRT